VWQPEWRGIVRLPDGKLTGCDVRCQGQAIRVETFLAGSGALGVEWEVKSWSPSVYVCFPGAVYAGNRFLAVASSYPCLIDDPALWLKDIPNVISDIPRLQVQEGASKIQLLCGDLSMPLIGFAGPGLGSVLLRVQPQTELGPVMIELQESDQRDRAWIRIFSPPCRDRRYHAGPTWLEERFESIDTPASVEFEIHAVVESGESPINLFHGIQRSRHLSTALPSVMPLSAAFDLVERKYNDVNWDPDHGYFACGDRQSDYSHWQMGWVGGGISAYALATSGRQESRERSARNVDWILEHGVSPSGLFWSLGTGTVMDTDMVDMTYGRDWHLIRRSGDGLYFLGRWAEMDFESRKSTYLGFRPCADVLVEIWQTNGQWGQFVSQFSHEIRIGGSTSAAIVPAALALWSHLVGDAKALETAELGAVYHHQNFVERGFTSGGPGEAAQCPDSESAFAHLESLMVLYEVSRDRRWLKLAAEAADLACSWVMDWNFEFPPESWLGRLRVQTVGSVWANAQNKHSAPGICTLSGSSLWRLSRALGEVGYLQVLQQIARGIPQYLATDERPIYGMRSGMMCERVNTSDWEHPEIPVGEGFPIGCWCEVSLMLIAIELPTVLIEFGEVSGGPRITAFDSTLARYENDILELSNPTGEIARVRLVVDNHHLADRPIDHSKWHRHPWISVGPGESIQITDLTPFLLRVID
jgi:hypothetical protein